MATMKMTEEQVDRVFCEMGVGEEYEGFKIVEKLPWEDEGKYQHRGVIFEYKGKTWCVWISRSGSYFTDYNYDYEDGSTAEEVERVEVVTYKWNTVSSPKSKKVKAKIEVLSE